MLAYCGRAVKDETPLLIFPNGFRPDTVIFNGHRIEQGDTIYVARDPLQVLKAYENGVTNVVSFLGDITVDALHVLALLMDEKDVPSHRSFLSAFGRSFFVRMCARPLTP